MSGGVWWRLRAVLAATVELGARSVWTRGVFDCDCCCNTWSRTDEQAGWHGEVWPDRDGRWRYSVHCLHTVAVPDWPGAARFVHCHGSDGPSTATFPAKAAAMAACEQAGTP